MNTSLAFTRNSGLSASRQAVPPALQQLSVGALLSIRAARPGSYYLGAELSPTGLMPISFSIARSPIVLATADYAGPDNYLDCLVKTAAITASQLYGNQTAAMAVTPQPESWGFTIVPRAVLCPEQFHQLLPQLLSGKSRGFCLIILEDIRPEWGIAPQTLLRLAENGFGLLLTAYPEYAAPLAHNIQSARVVIGNLTQKQEGPVLGTIPPLGGQLSCAQFAVRHKSQWLTFSTATAL
ncbi:MAG: hypothetical protein RBS68_15745 [Anaerolineales bacterium]|nr:hypothetical protein [Anaerolineales bacterium]